MSDPETVHGLNCPNCGGIVPVPEGQAIVRCPYCDLRSFVRGERGLRRYQIPLNIQQQKASDELHKFLTSNWAIANDAARRAQLEQAFLVHLPFWTVWGRVAGWAFGQNQEGSGDHKRYVPREVRVVQDMTWNGAACDVGEFGVKQVPLNEQAMQPFDPDALHATGLVFEPVNTYSEAHQTAERQFKEQVQRRASLERLSQLFMRIFRRHSGLVYYPLWVLRYLYRGRAFQVVIDGHSGKVLYGKAPGNTVFRAAMLVLGMAFGAFLPIDVPAFLISALSSGDDAELLGFAFLVFLAGVGIMYSAFRSFRYGEQYEYRQAGASMQANVDNPLETFTQIKDIKDIETWVNRLS